MSTPTNVQILDETALDGRARVARLHQELTDFLHFQSHIRLYAVSQLPPFVSPPDTAAKRIILERLKEEQRRLGILKWLIDTIEANNKDVIETLEAASSTAWGENLDFN
jgi:hypothetical protein